MLKQSISYKLAVTMEKKIFFSLPILLMTACTQEIVQQDSAPQQVPVDFASIADAVPQYEKRTRAGNPKQYEVFGKQYRVLADSDGYLQTGIASWYGTKFHGRKTSNGETYDMYGMTAAHKTLPIPSYVKVTNLDNQRSVVLRVNDRGPFHDNRIIDVSYSAAVKLGMMQAGTARVEVEALAYGKPQATAVESKSATQQEQVFYLQVGAFVNVGNAQELKKRLQTSVIRSARIQPTDAQGQQLYRVQVGPLYNQQQIRQTNEKLLAIGLGQSRLMLEN